MKKFFAAAALVVAALSPNNARTQAAPESPSMFDETRASDCKAEPRPRNSSQCLLSNSKGECCRWKPA